MSRESTGTTAPTSASLEGAGPPLMSSASSSSPQRRTTPLNNPVRVKLKGRELLMMKDIMEGKGQGWGRDGNDEGELELSLRMLAAHSVIV